MITWPWLIAEENEIIDPRTLQVGRELSIPPRENCPSLATMYLIRKVDILISEGVLNQNHGNSLKSSFINMSSAVQQCSSV